MNDGTLIGRVFNNLGGTYQKKGEFRTALNYFNRARAAVPPENMQLLWGILSNTAAAYENMDMISESARYSAQALELARSYGDVADQLHSINTLFQNYALLEDAPNMEKWGYLLDSLSQITQNNKHFHNAMYARGTIAFKKKEFDRAKTAFEKSLEYAEKTKNPGYIVGAKIVLADACIETGELDLASNLVQEIQDFVQSEPSSFYLKKSPILFGQSAMIKLKNKDALGAIADIKKMEALADSFQNPLVMTKAYSNISKIFLEDFKDFEHAYEYYVKFAALQETYLNSEKIREAAGLEIRYTFEQEKAAQDKKLLQLENDKLGAELRIREQQAALFRGKTEAEKREILVRLLNEEKSRQALLLENQSCALEQQELFSHAQADSIALLGKENELLAKDRQLQAAAIFQQRVWLIFSIFSAALLGTWLYFFYRRRQQKHLERLRLDIARDLHDDLGSSIGSIALFGKSLQTMLGDARPDAVAGLSHITKNAENSLGALRDIVWTIDSRQDSAEDFMARAHELIEANCAAAGVFSEIKTNLKSPGLRLHPSLKKNLWLILKEAVANALRYSETEKLAATIEFGRDAIFLKIQDFGTGFDPKTGRPSGNGLKNMALRAAEIRGKLDIESAPSRGTSVSIKCPTSGA